MRFKFLPHTADLKFRAYGSTIEEVFENSAYALFSSICEEKIEKKEKLKLRIAGKDMLNLFYNFLEELIFLVDSKDFLVSKVRLLKIEKKKFRLFCELSGDYGKNYEIHSHIKAVTYNEMFIKKDGKKWTAQVVLDV
ncbi:protein archease [Candidatus Pacearchaeota archaeon CG10_big_fil_rev_8_21_14_0_10_32_42]|nr:archease [Candidatus Pacearchaeota archaeon]PJE81222.1 MAG: protein archease [Candidatus Pacearchaeota archaeon CG10_big_fil_rev_8_21_14_0_10_32_42]